MYIKLYACSYFHTRIDKHMKLYITRKLIYTHVSWELSTHSSPRTLQPMNFISQILFSLTLQWALYLSYCVESFPSAESKRCWCKVHEWSKVLPLHLKAQKKCNLYHLIMLWYNFTFTFTGPSLFNIILKEVKVKALITFKQHLHEYLTEILDNQQKYGYISEDNSFQLEWAMISKSTT